MSWAEAKFSLNRTLGTKRHKPLNEIVSDDSYDSFYYSAKFLHSLLNGDDGIIFVPKGVSKIGNSQYRDNTDIIQVIIPSGVKSIEDSAFSFCSNLVDVYLPNSVQSIGQSAFLRCDSLKTFFIPDSVETIGNSAFALCANLTDIYIDRPETQAIEGAPWGATNATIHYKT